MKSIVIFSGTTEGKTLSAMLAKDGIRHHVCVATDYGKDVMEESSFAEVHVGRMDAEEMRAFFSGLVGYTDCVVVDATHPYASEVTANLKEVTDGLGIEYIRVLRGAESGQGKDGDVCTYSDIAECASALDRTTGNILLTTGSKELGTYCDNVSEDTRKRTYVRVLPAIDSLRICEEAGIEQSHIVAMQGPFSLSMNEALIRQYDIAHLVTKDSGTAGGFGEKKAAAESCGISLHVIRRPSDEQGVSAGEAYEMITGRKAPEAEGKMAISLIGMGMGTEKSLTLEGRKALDECDAVFGAERLLGEVAAKRKYPLYLAADIIPVLEKEEIKRAAIVFSGDTGFYSGAKKMIAALKASLPDADIRVIPGISSIAYLAAALSESYDDACLFSIHGKKTERELVALTDKVKHNRKVLVLLSGPGDVPEVAARLAKAGIKGRICVGENLSYENESIKELRIEEALEYSGDGISTALIYNDAPLRRSVYNAMRDSDFIRENVPMTKECIRHESILRLGLKEGDVFFDIGGGTGSVAIEAAGLCPDLDVRTFERKPEAAPLIQRNIEKAGLFNVTVVTGEAPECLEGQPKPDCVFIGGSGGKLGDIVETLHNKGEGIRFVVNAVSLETIEEARQIIKKYAPREQDAVVITVSDIEEIGTHHILKGQNPVWIFSFTL